MPKFTPTISILDSNIIAPSPVYTVSGSALGTVIGERDSLQQLSPQSVFGPSSHLIALKYTPTYKPQPFITKPDNSWQMASAILVVICMFCFALYRYYTSLRVLFKNCWSIEGTLTVLDNPSRDLAHFMTFSKIMLLTSLSISLTALVNNYFTQITHYFLAIIAIMAILSLAIWTQKILNKTCALTSDNIPLFANVRKIYDFNAAVFTFIYTPIAMITTLSNSGNIWIIILIAIFAIYHTIRIFTYLHFEKFSFLQWFLYLCGVEILPLTVFIALAIRLAQQQTFM